MTKLVIVESPAKVKTIKKFLPEGFKVDSCVGHIRDLPKNRKQAPKAVQDEEWADLGVDVDHGFEPVYVTIRGKGKVINRLKRELKNADELYLATDEDREGESISWHLAEALNPKVPVKRMVFNEITKEAVQRALENPRDVDMNLVEAQETRRILDRLYGYTLSPLLWRKVASGLSAGRVQSPAVRLIVEKERERRRFQSASYWDLQALLAKETKDFEATLLEVAGDRIATSSDFDEETGELKEGSEVRVLEEDEATTLVGQLRDGTWTVGDVEHRQRQSKPPAPFKTSSLQQEANGRLSLSPSQTMRIAQDLYEDGHITYMRTDSIALSNEALEGAKAAILAEWGDELYKRRDYARGDDDAAQEAHEAIRPSGATFTKPEDTGLKGRHLKLYDLIFRRTLASQMPNERYTSTTVLVDCAEARFKATGKTVDFHGYRLAWPTRSDKDTELPRLETGDAVDLKELDARSHETQPPNRYTEASLVEALEKEGIGRPSTYADIISKIIDKSYVVKQGRSLVPTLTAFAVVGFLERHFPKLVDTGFTSDMEKVLDDIAAGETDSQPYLEEFFLGDAGLRNQVEVKQEEVDGSASRSIEFEDLPYTIKIGRYGPYIEADVDGEVVRANLPENLTPDELTEDLVERLVQQRADGPPSLGADPESGLDIYVMTGRYGPYVQLGATDEVEGKPQRASLPDGMGVDDVTLEDALWLLSMPEEIGDHPDGGTVLLGIGRYGPYVCRDPGDDGKRIYKNVKDWRDLRGMELEEALERLSQAKKTTKRGKLKDVGDHPETGEPIELHNGRYGPYLKHAGTNKSLPEGMDPDEVTLEAALFLVSLPDPIGEHPEDGNVVRDLGRYGPYIYQEIDGDRATTLSLSSYEELQAIELEDALFGLELPTTLGEHPDGGEVTMDADREGAFLSHVRDGNPVKIVRNLQLSELRGLSLQDAVAKL